MNSFHLSLSLLALSKATEAVTPKMISEPAWSGKPFGNPVIEKALSSKYFVLLGDCEPDAPFEFELYGPSGVGAVGVSQEASEGGITVDAQGAEVHLGETQDFFVLDGIETFSDYTGYPVEYMLEAHTDTREGVTAAVTCTVATPVIVIAKDKADLEIHAVVTETKEGDEVEILGSPKARGNLKGYTKPKKNAGKSPVSFDSATDKKIRIKHEAGNSETGIALIDGYYTSADGYKVKRSLIQESKLKKDTFHSPREVKVQSLDINEDGDLEVSFPPGLLKSESSLLVKIRCGITLDGVLEPIDVVDVAAMLTEDKKITVHGGWIRKSLSEQNLDENSDGWDIALVDAVVTDPEDGYQVVAILKEKVQGHSKKNGGNKRRKLLSQKPSAEELEISEEMKMGRKPSIEQQLGKNLKGGRHLQAGHKKILVHGYCSGSNPFPISQFSNAVAFLDPVSPTTRRQRQLGDGDGLNNWSNDLFARKIRDFATNNGISGCGIIAHSQGGAASLHLYTYYWSCLDYAANPGRMIQSVGTPYQGTALAGAAATLGQVFGAGCGEQYDLTYAGASSWLSGIPTWARSQVNYYTTTFEDKWWRYDYCHVATDLLLSDPEDGTTEYAKGQLSYGVNRGHKDNWCHTTGMRDTAQYLDSGRNSEMNNNAQY